MAAKSVRGTQVGGDHYIKRKTQPIDVIEEYHLGFHLGNVIKYVLREKDKDDLDKALWYLKREIELRSVQNAQNAKPKR